MSSVPGGAVIVTGAAQGIGCCIAEWFAPLPNQLILIDRAGAVRDVASRLGARGIVVDVTDTADLRSQLAPVVDEHPPWLLVNNHGTFDKTPILDIDLDAWDAMQAINVRSMVALMQVAVPAMAETGRGGRVINIASMAAKLGTPGEAAYAASKAAVVALTRIAAMEFGPNDVTVNAVCPGYVLTDLGADTRSPADVEDWAAKSPLGRLAGTNDVAETVAFLASDAAGYITGESINVSGGMCPW